MTTRLGVRDDLTAADEPPMADAELDQSAEEGAEGWQLPPFVDRIAESRHLPTAFTWVRNIGAVILLLVAWQLWGTAIGEQHAQDALRTQFDQLIHAAGPAPATQTLIPAGVHVPLPAEGSVMAELSIPAIGLSQFVVSGTATDDLAKGPGHYIGTAMPGQAGNVAIAGHRTTHGAPFYRLGNIVEGDTINLTNTKDQHFTYVVSANPFPVSPGDTAVLGNFGDNRITLTTCNPPYSAIQRLIVVGELVTPGHSVEIRPTAPTGPSTPYRIADAATAAWRWGLLPVVAIEIAALVTLGLFNRRLVAYFGRFGGWMFLTPIWVGALCILFQTLTDFFPPSL
jgi:sortase A